MTLQDLLIWKTTGGTPQDGQHPFLLSRLPAFGSHLLQALPLRAVRSMVPSFSYQAQDSTPSRAGYPCLPSLPDEASLAEQYGPTLSPRDGPCCRQTKRLSLACLKRPRLGCKKPPEDGSMRLIFRKDVHMRPRGVPHLPYRLPFAQKKTVIWLALAPSCCQDACLNSYPMAVGSAVQPNKERSRPATLDPVASWHISNYICPMSHTSQTGALGQPDASAGSSDLMESF